MQIVEDGVDPMKEEALRDLNHFTEFSNYPKLKQYENFACHLNTQI